MPSGERRSLKEFPSECLNVDLEIKSRSNPALLIRAWNRRVMQMHSNKLGRRHWVRVMLWPQPSNPNEALRRFARLVRGLPASARTVWDNASKELDIGIQAGLEQRSGEWVIDAAVAEMVGQLGASIRLTIYSPWEQIRDRSKTRRRLSAKSQHSTSK